MNSGFLLLMMIASLIGVLAMALNGRGYRGLYGGLAIAFVVFGWCCFELSTVDLDPTTATKAQLEGERFLALILPPVGLWSLGTALACLIATVMFRAKRVTP